MRARATQVGAVLVGLARRGNPWGALVAALAITMLGELLSPYGPLSAILTLAGLVAVLLWWRPMRIEWVAFGWVVLFASFGDRIHLLAAGSLGADDRASMLSILLLIGALVPLAGSAYQPSFRVWLRRALFNDPWTVAFAATMSLLPLLAPLQGYPVQILYGCLLGLAALTTLAAAAWIASRDEPRRWQLLTAAVIVPVAINAVNSVNQFLFYRGVALPGSKWLIAADRALWSANWRHMLVERSTGMYLNSNTLAILALTGVAFALFGPLTRAARSWLVGLSLLLVLLSQSRTAVVALLVLGVWAFARREDRFDRRRVRVVAVAVTVVLVALVVAALLAPSQLGSLLGERWTRLLGGGLGSDPSLTGRVMFWTSSFSTLLRHPLGTWGPPQRFTGLPTDSEYVFDLLSGGVVMLGIWIAVLVAAWRRAGSDPRMRSAARALVIVLAVLGVTQDLHSAAPFVTLSLLVLAATMRRAPVRDVPTRPRVLMLSHLFPRNAEDHAGIFVKEQACALSKITDLTVLVARYDDAPADESSGDFAVEVIRLPGSPRRFGALGLLVTLPFYVRRAVRRARALGSFDVVHGVYGYPDGVAAVLAGRSLGVPVAVSLLGNDYFRQIARPLVGDLTGWAIASANRVVCVNDTMAAGMRRRFTLGSDSVVTLATGYSANHAVDEPTLQREHFLLVANLIPRKAPDAAVRAFAAAAPRMQERLVIVGDGPMRAELEVLAARLGIADRVEFAGAVPHDQLHHFYRGASALVLPSLSEGMPVVVNEALASGVPVVASRLPGTEQQVRSELVGILVEPGDEGALAEALIKAAETSWDYRELRRLSGVMSWDECAVRLVRIYGEIIVQPAPGWLADSKSAAGLDESAQQA